MTMAPKWTDAELKIVAQARGVAEALRALRTAGYRRTYAAVNSRRCALRRAAHAAARQAAAETA